MPKKKKKFIYVLSNLLRILYIFWIKLKLKNIFSIDENKDKKIFYLFILTFLIEKIFAGFFFKKFRILTTLDISGKKNRYISPPKWIARIFFKPTQLENDDDDTRFPARILLPLVLEMRSIVRPQDFLRNFFALAFLSPLLLPSSSVRSNLRTDSFHDDCVRSAAEIVSRGDIDFFIKLYGLQVLPSGERFTLAPPLFPPESCDKSAFITARLYRKRLIFFFTAVSPRVFARIFNGNLVAVLNNAFSFKKRIFGFDKEFFIYVIKNPL